MAHRWTNYLRKNSTPILAFMGVVCMITFVVGPYLLDWVSGASRSRVVDDPVVVTWVKGSIREADLQDMRVRHNVAVRFMEQVIGRTIEAGGSPVVGGQTLTKQTGISTVGFEVDDSDAGLIRTMLLAEDGRRMGLSVNQASVMELLREISSPELGDADLNDIADAMVEDNNVMGITELFDQLAYELRAQHVRMLIQRGLLAMPPAEIWDYFNRLNRRFSIEAYPIDVQPLVAQVTGEPTAAELQALFEEGQSRDPNPSVAEPGFHQPLRLAFDYVKVDFKPFLENAKKQVTEEQIQARYKEDVAQGLHKVVELPIDPTKPPAGEKPAAGDKPADGNAPADGEKKNDETPAKAEEKNDTPKPAEKPAENKPAEEKPAKADGSSGGGCEDPPAETETKPAEKPTNEKPADPAKPAEPAKPGEEKPADASVPADPTKPAEPKNPAEPPKETKFKPLEEVRDQILTSLAQPIAQEAQNAAVKKVMDEINAFGKAYRRWQSVQDQKIQSQTVKDPGKLNLSGLASRHGFTSGTTPLVDRFTVREHELGQKVSVFNFQLMQMGHSPLLSFSDIAFGNDVPLYDAQQADSSEPDISYIYFRTQVNEARDVKLAEAKDQVVAAWKKNRAFELAIKDATTLAEKAKGVNSLKDVVPEPTKVLTPAPFSWMSTGSLAFGFGQPGPSQVDGIELTGDEFMRAVFALSPGEAGVAPNNSHTRVYVVRVIAQSPSDELLREQFLDSGFDGIGAIANREVSEIFQQWFKDLDSRMQVKWHRPARAGGRT